MNKVVILFLFKVTFQACSDGCLKCISNGNDDTKCALCDVFNQFQFNSQGDDCEKKIEKDCIGSKRISSTKYKCLICVNHKYPGDDGKCLPVTKP